MRSAAAPILYISYDGMLEPLGQSQVLAYLERLACEWPVHLISFEKTADRQDAVRMSAMRERMKTAGINWTPLAYHKTPSAPATAYDMAIGTAVALQITLRYGVRIIHARSYVPALMALSVKRLTGARFVFDMRGFWADERVDGGLWPRDCRLYRVAKRMERTFLQSADHIVTLTHASVREIARFDYLQTRMAPVTVIPTCADLEAFRPIEVEDRPLTLGYVGSVGTWYLFDEFLSFFRVLLNRRTDARLLIVNRNEHEHVRSAIHRAGISLDRCEILSSEHHDVPHHIARMHAGSAIIKPTFSKLASAPTKFAEYLGCGVPCVGNAGVGDMQEILEGERVGVALTDLSPPDMEAAAESLLALLSDPDTRQRCVETARRIFSLDDGVEKYDGIYRRLTARHA